MIIYVDIDETICTLSHTTTTTRDYTASKPILENINKINKLYEEGHTIIYWTARGSTSGIDWEELTKSQLERWNCKHHGLKLGKPSYDIYIDDKSFNTRRFEKVETLEELVDKNYG